MDFIKEVIDIGFKKTFVDVVMVLVATKYIAEIIDYYRYKYKSVESKRSKLGSHMKKAD